MTSVNPDLPPEGVPDASGSQEVTYEGILQGLLVYWRPGDIHEIRHFRRDIPAHQCLGTADAAAKYIYSKACQDHPEENFYLVMNPVSPDAKIEIAVRDDHILHRRRFVLDIDPHPKLRKVNDKKVSATEQELGAVRQCALTIITKLQTEFGWPEPVVIMSGNGYHLVFEIDLLADDNSKSLLSKVLKAVNALYGIPGVADIDETVFNASRVIKIPGTVARRGIKTPERPHRLARIVSKPIKPSFVSLEQLERVAECAPKKVPPAMSRRENYWSNRFGAESQGKPWTRARFIDFLDNTGIGYRDPVPFEGGQKFVLDSCPFGPHRKITAAVFYFPDGRMGFNCKEMPDCRDRHWADFRALYDLHKHARLI
jgi:hypothetical protein